MHLSPRNVALIGLGAVDALTRALPDDFRWSPELRRGYERAILALTRVIGQKSASRA